jgi:hypothetical protein
MCDIVVQAPTSSSSWMLVVSTHFSILVSVRAQWLKIHVYFNPLPNSEHKSP